ncbi:MULTISPECIES: ABC transporter ATP-binding protein [unclassified Shinella]|jgi:iron(III) transport system ATP-binding protein|uniref:ABC transporter ATP-binding protein n=1 Tax=unclassified Shinella TaxID=2643062 RepID=UPI0003C53345|nr:MULTISPECIES: ABC transporter ATP-binding protein [unclassified Shinella]MCA0320466.1 ABC transporter ATP-binding protein [Pseudomonadota bacterium]EYR83863.1 ABC-type spermidine/putrescine transport systemATPase component [Shinella sp. DD12]MCA0338933.1 ABC transporter ATP-binding protein [Pseudomonadota bacterium]MCO5152126.1 ABC transporter ATP-binding protein [Shinella sp.]MDC7266678.1 ABC transporter ATP-binding protein [Shinella sp. HY16]
MTELVVSNVQKWLGGLQILKGASFTAQRGSIVALLGASGSGKTTLLRCVAGLEQPEIGQIVIGGKTVLDGERKLALPPEQRNIGLVFQSYALWPHRTVRENVGYGLKLRGVTQADIEKRVQAILERMGLGHLADRFPSQLSGGQQQRVAICRALVYEPRVLLLDEPLSNLDAKLREEARYWIRKLILDLEICAILVTHDQSEALAAADNILLLQDGRIVQQGGPQEIYSNPNSFYSADFLGANNIVKAKVKTIDGKAAIIGGDDWSLDGTVREAGGLAAAEDARAVIRVEQIRVSDQPEAGSLEMTLDDSIYLGDRWEYRLRRGDFVAKAHGARQLSSGRVWARVPPESVWVFSAGQR